MRVADYIFQRLADYGVKHIFLVTGGGAMFLNDAIGKEPRLKYICNLHEQACAMAAEGYARISGMPGVINVTTGPGGTNALTGVVGAWLDSIPLLVISGQIKRATSIETYPHLHLRQLGDQELNIIDVVKPITKYAVYIKSPSDICEELEKAWYICRTGRPGPVWIDVPLDIQAAEIEPASLQHYVQETKYLPPPPSQKQLEIALDKIQTAKRPVIIAGIGVRHGNGIQKLLRVAEKCQIPILTSISGIDLIPSNHPLFFGRPGIMGNRHANFIMQNSDLLLVIGTRLGLRIIGYAYDKIARNAFKIMVDADESELLKPTFHPDLAVHADAGEFIDQIDSRIAAIQANPDWIGYCRTLRKKYPPISNIQRERNDYVSSYVLPEIISENCQNDAIIVTGNGTAYTSTFQAIQIKEQMRLFANEGCASMGYGLPAAIGAACVNSKRQVICLTGDGSIQMNIQELQTLVNYRLPVKIFVYNNGGYLSIKLTQRAFFHGHFVGSEANSGVILPQLEKIAQAYGIPYFCLANNQEAATKMPKILSTQGAVLIEVLTDPFEELGPKAASKKLPDGTMVSAPLEDMAPFLPRDEFNANMIIPPMTDDSWGTLHSTGG